MSFLAPIAGLVAAALTVPALIALYFLKLRRRELVIPSTLLWRKAIEDMQVNAPFQRLRRNLLLLLQLLILAALVVAMARPTMDATAHPGQRVAILIDHSASMNATDGRPTRLDQARDRAMALIDGLASAGSEAMVVGFAEQPRTLQQFTGDPSRLRAAVESIEPTDQRSRLAAALQLIEPHAQAAAEDEASSLRVYVLTDGRVHREAGRPPTLTGAEIEYVRMGGETGEGVDNLGFVAFSARRDFERPERVQVFARLANAGAEAIETQVALRIDGRTVRRQAVRVPAARVPEPTEREGEADAGAASGGEPGTESVQFQFTLAESALVSVHHDHADMLAADDAAHLVLAPARRLRVGLVSAGNAFLERVIESVGVRGLERLSPQRFERIHSEEPERLRRGGWEGALAEQASFDVLVFDGHSPETVPNVDSLYFNAAPPIDGLALRPAHEDAPRSQALLDWQRDHPLLRHIVLDDLLLSRPGRLAVPMDGHVLATAQAGPVLATVRDSGAQHIVAGFDVLDTNWPMQVSFPVFLSNVVETLGLGNLADEAGVAYRAGEVAAVPGPAGETLEYDGPRPLRATVEAGEAVLPRFERVGVYEAQRELEPPFDRLAVNLLDPTQTDLRPMRRLTVGTHETEAREDTGQVRREVWPWFAWAALGVLLLEWLVYTRRMHL